MVQNRSEPFGTGLKAELNPWNQCILVRSGSVTFVVWFRFETVPNRTVATLINFLKRKVLPMTVEREENGSRKERISYKKRWAKEDK